MKLIVLDADGVLSKGEARPFDLSLFERLADLNRRARREEPVPAVTLNTGRPSPYVEAVMQAIDGWQPALYENGAGLYHPRTYQFETTPLFTNQQAAMMTKIIDRLDRTVVRSNRAYWQPGKSICHTLFARPPLTVAQLVTEVGAIVSELSDQFTVSRAGLALNIHPAGVNKGTGLQWLARATNIEPEQMGGVGDSAGDVDFLQLVGRSAAPANATTEVKAVVQYLSPHPDTVGLHDILNHWLAL
jgi:hydroxymethylpyrimidine pyrophosphatase-like HAD family hydrolase